MGIHLQGELITLVTKDLFFSLFSKKIFENSAAQIESLQLQLEYKRKKSVIRFRDNCEGIIVMLNPCIRLFNSIPAFLKLIGRGPMLGFTIFSRPTLQRKNIEYYCI